MKALLVVVIALLVFVGAIVGALALGGGGKADVAPAKPTGDPVAGKRVAARPDVNCILCHSDDGVVGQGPSFKGLWGSVVKYDDGSSELIDDRAVRAALREPNAKVMENFDPRMPSGLLEKMSEADVDNLLAYLRSVGVRPVEGVTP